MVDCCYFYFPLLLYMINEMNDDMVDEIVDEMKYEMVNEMKYDQFYLIHHLPSDEFEKLINSIKIIQLSSRFSI